MCSSAKSSETKSCLKNELHTNPSVPTSPHTRTELHTKPRGIARWPKNMMKKIQTETKQCFFKLLCEERPWVPPEKGLHPFRPRTPTSLPPPQKTKPSFQTNWENDLGSNWVKTLISATPYARFKIWKIRQKLGFKKFSIFFRLKPAPGHGLS